MTFFHMITQSSLRRNGLVIGVASILFACSFCTQAQVPSYPDNKAATVSMPVAPLDEAGKRREAILTDLRNQLADLHATQNADFDFAAFQQMYSEAARRLAQEELQHGQDAAMQSHAKHILNTQDKDRPFLEHWIERFRQFD